MEENEPHIYDWVNAREEEEEEPDAKDQSTEQPKPLEHPKEPEFSKETIEYLHSLKEELDEIYKWISDSNLYILFKEIRGLQDKGPEYSFFQKKAELYESYKQQLLPKLIEIRRKRVLPPGVEIVTIGKKMNEKYNFTHLDKLKKLEEARTFAGRRALEKSLQPQKPIDEFTQYIRIREIPEKLEQSLQIFWLAENFRKSNDENSFRLDIWIEKIRRAQLTLEETLKEI
jgi:hypothetical protein